MAKAKVASKNKAKQGAVPKKTARKKAAPKKKAPKKRTPKKKTPKKKTPKKKVHQKSVHSKLAGKRAETKRPAAGKAKRKAVVRKKVTARPTVKATPLAAGQSEARPTTGSQIGALCDAILALHIRAKTPLASAFLPGLSDDEIDALMKPTGLRLPQSARDLYKWRNGVDRKKKGAYDFFYRMMMFPLHEQIKYSYESYVDVREDYNKNWFPLFDTETADSWAIDCSSPQAADAPIIDFDNYDIDHVAGFASLEQCLSCMLTAFEQGVLGFGERTVDIDFKRFGKLMAKLNPEVADFWKNSG